METCYFSVTSRFITYKGKNFTFSPIIPILTAMGIAEVWWDGTIGNKLSFDGTRTTIDNVDDLQVVMDLIHTWTDKNVCFLWVSPAPYTYEPSAVLRCSDFSARIGYIVRPDSLEKFKSDTGETDLEIPAGLIMQWYYPDEDMCYKLNADGTKETISWEQGKRIYAQLPLIGGPMDDTNVNYIGM